MKMTIIVSLLFAALYVSAAPAKPSSAAPDSPPPGTPAPSVTVGPEHVVELVDHNPVATMSLDGGDKEFVRNADGGWTERPKSK